LVDTIVAASGASLKMTWPDAYTRPSALPLQVPVKRTGFLPVHRVEGQRSNMETIYGEVYRILLTDVEEQKLEALSCDLLSKRGEGH